MERNALFWDSGLTVNKVVIIDKLTFKFSAVLTRIPLVCL